ncbi:MAG: ABC transporter permease [Candidatus Hodarchaeota archaeon]
MVTPSEKTNISGSLTQMTWSSNLNIVWHTFIARSRIILRYKGFVAFDVLIPILISAMPILMGNAIAGSPSAAAANFAANTGTDNHTFYILIGSCLMMVCSGALWQFGFWFRREQMTGTLETLYLVPASRFNILMGISLYVAVRSIITFVLALLIGNFVFGVSFSLFLSYDFLIALTFIILGLIPMFGMGFLFGALILQIKEAQPLLNLFQWVIYLLVGSFYPITALPIFLRIFSYLFPPTWVTQGVRASLLELEFFLETWYLDLAIVFMFALLVPYLGYWLFTQIEQNLQKNQGIGEY